MAPVIVYSIFYETLAKEDVDFEEMDYSDDGDFKNEDEKHLLDLVSSVLETMNNHGKVDDVTFILRSTHGP
jgi:hypothetical protein